jgi:hypothetical protein
LLPHAGPMNDAVFARARLVTQAVLDTLGHHAPPWTVLRVGWAPEPDDYSLPRGVEAPAPHSHVLVELGGDGETVGVHFPLVVAEAEATSEVASQIQDHAMESATAWGRALPPCPGHDHPLTARVVGGVAVWECPASGGGHYREAVMDPG